VNGVFENHVFGRIEEDAQNPSCERTLLWLELTRAALQNLKRRLVLGQIIANSEKIGVAGAWLPI
jgi:hypothetical protein